MIEMMDKDKGNPMPIDPTQDIPISPLLSSLPKADLHIHQEDLARFERMVAQRMKRPAYDPRSWIKQMMVETPPGIGRIAAVYSPDKAFDFNGFSPADPQSILAKIAGAMLDGANSGAVVMGLRFGTGSVAFSQPDFMALFHEAERQVQAVHPGFHAEADIFIVISDDQPDQERQFQACLQAARDGLSGIDFRIDPYDLEAHPSTWRIAYRMAEKALAANLGITIHVGEFSSANILAAVKTPGVSRLGHAVYTASDPLILDAVARSRVTVECSMTCNVALGAVPSYEEHPIRQFVAAGIPVSLATDLPIHLHTSIAREYAIAAHLGFSLSDLLRITRDSIRASFLSPENKVRLLMDVDRWAVKNAAALTRAERL